MTCIASPERLRVGGRAGGRTERVRDGRRGRRGRGVRGQPGVGEPDRGDA